MLFSKVARPSMMAIARRSMSGGGAHGGHQPNPEMWEKIFYFLCVPAISLSMLNTFLAEKQHMEHFHRPEFKAYEYMRIRRKKFPWGDGNHSLFHNARVNPLPDGYETDEEGNFIK